MTISSNQIIPPVGLGTWMLRGEECERTLRQGLDLGYQHIDTADAYGNHQAVGRAIKKYPREGLFLTTKVGINSLLPAEVDAAVPRFFKRAGC